MTTTETRTLHSLLDLMAALVEAEDFDPQAMSEAAEDWAAARCAASSDSIADQTTELVMLWMAGGVDMLQDALDEAAS